MNVNCLNVNLYYNNFTLFLKKINKNINSRIIYEISQDNKIIERFDSYFQLLYFFQEKKVYAYSIKCYDLSQRDICLFSDCKTLEEKLLTLCLPSEIVLKHNTPEENETKKSLEEWLESL